MAFIIDGPVEVKRIHELTSESDLTGCEFITDKETDANSKKAAASLLAGQTNHNELLGLQGGKASEYYHLTAAQYAFLGSRIESNDTLNSLDFESAGKEGNAFMTLDTGKEFNINDALIIKEDGDIYRGIAKFITSPVDSVTTLGVDAGQLITSATNLILIGNSAGAKYITGSANSVGIGNGALANVTTTNNVAVGQSAGDEITGESNTSVGHTSGRKALNYCTMLGAFSGGFTNVTSNSVYIGYDAGEYESANNVLMIGSTWSSIPTVGSEAEQRNEAIIYGIMDSTTANQVLTFNSQVKITQLPTYANEAAAVIGGIATDSIYKTATGEIRIKL